MIEEYPIEKRSTFEEESIKIKKIPRLFLDVVSGQQIPNGPRKVQRLEYDSDKWTTFSIAGFVDKARSFIHDIGLELIPDEALEIWLDTYEAAILKGATVEEATGFAWAAVGKHYIKTGDNSRWVAFSEDNDEWMDTLLSSSNPIIDVFRAGDYPQGTWSTEDIDELVDNYDTSIFKAPITLDHSQAGPAMGWVSKIFRRGDVLYAILEDMGKKFLDRIRAKEYINRSIEIFELEYEGKFYWPYFKAVTFLGAAPPQVKGLSDPAFKKKKMTLISIDDDKFNSSFSDNIKTEGEGVVPKLEFTQAEFDEKMRIATEKAVVEFKATIETDKDEGKRKQELADKDAKIVELNKTIDESKRSEFTTLAETTYQRLYTEGKLLPPEKEFFLNFMKILSADDTTEIEFSEKIKGTKVKAFVAFMDQMKARVPKEQRLQTIDPNEEDKTKQRPKKYDGASDLQVNRQLYIDELMKEDFPDAKASTPEWRTAFAECHTKAIEKYPNE